MLRTFDSERDRLLLRQEVERLKAKGYSFQGETESERLGVDAWVLSVGLVEERKPWRGLEGRKQQ